MTTIASQTKLPGRNLTSLNELKDHGFDPDSNAPAFYWSEHKLSGSGVRNLTAKAFSLHTEQVSNAEAWFSLTISNLLIQLTESQRELFAQCMLHAASSQHPQLSIFEHTRVPTSEDDFQKFYLSGPNAIVPNLPHPIPKTTTDGTHSFVGLTDLLANELAKATTFDKFYFESNVQFLPKDVTTFSTTPSAYKLYLDLKEDDQDQYVLYLWYKEWSDDFDHNNTKASRNQGRSNTFTICPPEGQSQGRNSYFMSLSCKGEDHSEIEIEFHKELEFYHGGLKRIIKVKMGKLLLCVDRPERTSILQVGDHNGTFSTFWGHSCKVDGYCKENNLPSCKDCRKHCLHRIIAEKNMNLMRQICFLSVMEQIIFMLNAIHKTIPYKHATEEIVHHGMSFILHLNFVYQQTIQPTMTNGLVPHCLLMEGSLISQFKEQNECCVPFV